MTNEIANNKIPNNIRLRGILRLIIISLFFYAGSLFWTWTPISKSYTIAIPIPILGRLIIYPTLIRLRNYNLGWPYYSVLVITLIFLIFDIAFIAGSKYIFYAYYTPVELILILLILKRLITIEKPDSYIIQFISKIVLIEGILFSISMAINVLLILVLYLQIQILNDLYHPLMTLMVSSIQSLALHLVMSTLIIYAAWQIRKSLSSNLNLVSQ